MIEIRLKICSHLDDGSCEGTFDGLLEGSRLGLKFQIKYTEFVSAHHNQLHWVIEIRLKIPTHRDDGSREGTFDGLLEGSRLGLNCQVMVIIGSG